MKILRLVLPLVLLCTVAMPVLAEPGGDAPRGAGGPAPGILAQQFRAVIDELQLSDEQKAKVDPILTKAADDLRQMFAETRDLSPQERFGKVREYLLEVHGRIAEVLTDEQKTQFDQKLQEIRQARGQGAGQGQAGSGGAQLVRRLHNAIDKLDLTSDQKPQVEDIFKDLETKLGQLRLEAQSDPQAAREKGRKLFEEAREQLVSVLTPQQQAALRDLMQNSAGDGTTGSGNGERGAGLRRGRNGAATKKSSKDSPKESAPAATQPVNKENASGAKAPQPVLPGTLTATDSVPKPSLEYGQVAPDFALKRLDGSTVQLSSFKDKLLVAAFGSYTSPSFRQRAAALDELRRDFGARASFLLVYTKEAHPAGGWEIDRNKEANISVAPHKDDSERRNAARTARDLLHLEISTATDSMDDAAATAYHASPNNAAVLIGRDGKILTYQQWFDPTTMREAITAAIPIKLPAAGKVEPEAASH